MNLDESQAASKSDDYKTIYSRNELVEQGILMCLQGASKVSGRFGPQWEILIVHHGGSQKIWFPALNKQGQPSYWDRVFTGVTEWPNHSYKLVAERGKFWRFVAQPDQRCPCQDDEVESILTETMGEDAPASGAQMHALVTLRRSLGIEPADPGMLTARQWQEAMTALALKQAGVTV
jgi:hypothetical protein